MAQNRRLSVSTQERAKGKSGEGQGIPGKVAHATGDMEEEAGAA